MVDFLQSNYHAQVHVNLIGVIVYCSSITAGIFSFCIGKILVQVLRVLESKTILLKILSKTA